jgi:hypothetical protein
MTAAKFKPLILSMSGFALSNVANIFKQYSTSNSSSVVACVLTAVGTLLPNRCLEMELSGDTQAHRQQGEHISLVLFVIRK